jgi:hypothetical protein
MQICLHASAEHAQLHMHIYRPNFTHFLYGVFQYSSQVFNGRLRIEYLTHYKYYDTFWKCIWFLKNFLKVPSGVRTDQISLKAIPLDKPRIGSFPLNVLKLFDLDFF